ncbi:trigger factor [Lysobacter concretionis Ko07 = DSM 16239]|uniref:Trigger factor n=1 Tax=Lysobacter concretionis Ko07 = DSM 16239 TaxID=1122185 RepID=A0A0A0EQF5_9GAMM|nr:MULTISPECIES: trigger factor [Lysobacter]KGM52455.1 trigger factor [Lysobacter concretionis Ko07 = DSM 16239]QOD91795.1 trigger factor [Lysobacter sp. CW239]
MQVSVESLGALERRMTFNLPADRFESEVGGRLREISRGAKIKGFRPGKIPAKVIEQRFGPQVRAEVLDNLVRETFGSAVREQSLQIAGNPFIEPAGDAAAELAYVATFEVVPDFGEIDVSKLNVVRHTSEVKDEDIDTMVENLRLQRRTWNVVERAAQEGDAVELETFSTVDGERLPAEGAERGTTVIGSGAMLPAIESALVGMKAGESKDTEIEFPSEWRVPQFAGKKVLVSLTVGKVSEPVLPDVDEAFIKSFGIKSGDAEQFRADIRSNLERELKGALMSRLRREVGEQLIAAYSELEMPPKLVENEARDMANQAAEQARRQGRNVELPADAHLQFLEPARKRVLVGLLVGEVARANALKLDPKRVNETLNLIASTYEEPQQVIELYRNDRQLMTNLQGRVMEEQVIDWIAERAQHTEQPLAFAEAIRQ